MWSQSNAFFFFAKAPRSRIRGTVLRERGNDGGQSIVRRHEEIESDNHHLKINFRNYGEMGSTNAYTFAIQNEESKHSRECFILI